jgi:hypothetical protein
MTFKCPAVLEDLPIMHVQFAENTSMVTAAWAFISQRRILLEVPSCSSGGDVTPMMMKATALLALISRLRLLSLLIAKLHVSGAKMLLRVAYAPKEAPP